MVIFILLFSFYVLIYIQWSNGFAKGTNPLTSLLPFLLVATNSHQPRKSHHKGVADLPCRLFKTQSIVKQDVWNDLLPFNGRLCTTFYNDNGERNLYLNLKIKSSLHLLTTPIPCMFFNSLSNSVIKWKYQFPQFNFSFLLHHKTKHIKFNVSTQCYIITAITDCYSSYICTCQTITRESFDSI